MKTNKIFILINELKESHFGKVPGLEKPEISFQELLSLNEDEMVSITAEDIFIGSTAKWDTIKERIEDFYQLSYLREGKLDVIYYSIYDVLTRLYTNDADNYFHFYDNCVKRIEIEDIVQQFPSSFSCNFKNLSNENLKKELQVNEKGSVLRKASDVLNFDFLTITNKIARLQIA